MSDDSNRLVLAVLASNAVARQARSELPDGLYHVTAQAICGAQLFVDDDDRRSFLWLLEFVVARFELACRAYCLMGTHEHLLSGSSSAHTVICGARWVLLSGRGR